MGSGTKQLVQKGGGPNGADIYVDPEAIRAVVKDFKTHLPKLVQQIARYEAHTQFVDGEFGRLTFLDETRHVGEHYVEMRKKNLQALKNLAGNLAELAMAMDVAQQYYDQADGKQPTPLLVST